MYQVTIIPNSGPVLSGQGNSLTAALQATGADFNNERVLCGKGTPQQYKLEMQSGAIYFIDTPKNFKK